MAAARTYPLQQQGRGFKKKKIKWENVILQNWQETQEQEQHRNYFYFTEDLTISSDSIPLNSTMRLTVCRRIMLDSTPKFPSGKR